LTKREEWRTESVEDFLKTVYLLQQETDPVPTSLIAESLKITAPSVTDMIKRLAGVDRERKDDTGKPVTPLLEYEKHKGVRLTAAGERIALEVIRHHRLIELYLSQALGYSWDEVHSEADKLEHHISEQFEARIASVLGHPQLDPHGDPIPAVDGTITPRDLLLLSHLRAGQTGHVSRITDQNPELLRYLSGIGLVPGAEVHLSSRAPLNDTVSIRIAEEPQIHTISMTVAGKVMVDTGEGDESD
jgi:DtxR family transcriptional regulator, Mn-dependent transcriptional regulator